MSVIGTGLKSDHLRKGPRANVDGRHRSVRGLWKALRFAALATACCLVSVTSASAQEEINVSAKVTGNKARGPKEIHLTHVNTLRYDVGVNRSVSYTPGLSLSEVGGFIPKSPAVAARSTAAVSVGGAVASAGSPPLGTPEGDYNNDLVSVLNQNEDIRAKLQDQIERATDAVNMARQQTEAFLLRTDTMLAQENGPAIVFADVNRLLPAIESAARLEYGVVTIGDETVNLNSFLVKMERLGTAAVNFKVKYPAWSASNAPALKHIEDRIADLKSAVNAVDRNSEQGQAFLRNQTWLNNWAGQMREVTGPESFSLKKFKVDCSFAFSATKETKVELTLRDRLSGATTGTSQEVITVVCSAPISLSGGFGFSAIDEKEFIFVQSTKTTTDAMGRPVQSVVNRFGLKNSSSFRALPLLLINTRVWERSDLFAIHVSAGAGVDVKTGQAGTDIEYIVGPSISFRRSVFVTPGLHVGRVPSLAGGFKLDDEVPTGVSQPPITKTWGKGFAVTFTYIIR